jgi:glutamate-1-semialdehyde 2,1-aminomutase
MATRREPSLDSVPTTRGWASPKSQSSSLHARGRQVIPAGSSRQTLYMPPNPPYAHHGEGCWIVGVDGDRWLDMLNNFTAMIHGHAHPAVIEAAIRQVQRGTAFPMPSAEEGELAALLVDRLPSVERVIFNNSGTEAVMCAIRAARGFTGRPKIAKFEGAYHGTYDYAEVSQSPSPAEWGPLEAPRSVPVSKGTPQGVLDDVVVLPFNRPELAVQRIEQEAKTLAAVLLDPVANRVGMVPARPEFLRAIREVTAAHGILLIFDEVICLRLGYHGAQGHFGMRPDLTTMGKIIGGGFPVGAVGGRADVMEVFDPQGGKPAVQYGGTFTANPVTMAAGLATMRLLDERQFQRMDELGSKMRAALAACFKDLGVPGRVTGVGSLFRIHLFDRELIDYRTANPSEAETQRLKRLHRRLMEHGVIIAPQGLGCLSTPMGDAEIELMIETFAACLKEEAGG